jgi:uncharacterized protein YecE (DUF72 family)
MLSGEKLSYYARFFDAVEVRATFWDESLGPADAREWATAVNGAGEFLFLVKLHRSFTHTRNLRSQVTRSTRGLLQELERHNTLGALLVQFPYSFTNTSANRYYLTKLAEIFRGFPLHVEFRHASWEYGGLMGLMNETGMEPVHADLPRIRQFAPFLTAHRGETAYFRLHGRNDKGWLLNGMDTRYDYLYNGRELQELRRRIENVSQKCRRTMVIFNNTSGGKAVANALQLLSSLRGAKPVRVPDTALHTFPFLQSIVPLTPSTPSLFGDNSYREAM